MFQRQSLQHFLALCFHTHANTRISHNCGLQFPLTTAMFLQKTTAIVALDFISLKNIAIFRYPAEN